MFQFSNFPCGYVIAFANLTVFVFESHPIPLRAADCQSLRTDDSEDGYLDNRFNLVHLSSVQNGQG